MSDDKPAKMGQPPLPPDLLAVCLRLGERALNAGEMLQFGEMQAEARGIKVNHNGTGVEQ